MGEQDQPVLKSQTGPPVPATPGQIVLDDFIHVGIPIILIGAFVLLIIRTVLLKIELAGPGFTLKTERNAVAEMLSDLLNDVRDLTREDKDLFMKIRNRISRQGKVTVQELFPDFTIGSDGYQMLRSLQCSHLIRPTRGGKWDKDSGIQLTAFGDRLAIQRPNLFTPGGSPLVHD
jgi:hypothetical protein